MKGTIILGAGFGDEGKGVTVHSQIDTSTLVVRFNGGGQAGHTVVHDGRRHVFSNYGSGALKGASTFWSKYCAFDPTATYMEGKSLGFPMLWVSKLCPVVTPFDIYVNQNNISYINNGTVGCGIGTTFKRHESFYTLYAGDLLYPDIVKTKLELIRTKFYALNHLNLTSHVERFLELSKLVLDKINLINDSQTEMILRAYDNIIFEGAQGILLDQHFGFFPHVTRSCTTSKNVVNDLVFSKFVDEVIYVTRPYHTRHGNGPFTNEEHLDKLNLVYDSLETNVKHKFQGDFKRTILNLDLLKYAIECDENYSGHLHKSICITCLDQVSHEDTFYVTKNNKLLEIKSAEELVFHLNLKFKSRIEISSDDATKIRKFNY